MSGNHVLALFDELNGADRSMTRHLNLLHKLHLAHIPEVYEPIVVCTSEDTVRVLLQARDLAEIAVP